MNAISRKVISMNSISKEDIFWTFIILILKIGLKIVFFKNSWRLDFNSVCKKMRIATKLGVQTKVDKGLSLNPKKRQHTNEGTLLQEESVVAYKRKN